MPAKSLILTAATLLAATTFASENGKYYVCDAGILNSDNKCIFALSGRQPSDWIQEPVKHNIDRAVGPDGYRGIRSYNGDMLHVAPRPWTNGDELIGTIDPVVGDDWSGYSLIFELIAPLRDMVMYDPDALTDDVWNAYTRALTDCHIKTDGGEGFSTSQVYDKIKNPNNKDTHNILLQYLEESAIELVCLSSSLKMDHCDAIRETAGAGEGDRCNCWFDAYEALYDACPVIIDTTFKACPGTTPATMCTD